MKSNVFIIMGCVLVLFASSCVSSKKYKAQKNRMESLNTSFAKSQSDLNACEYAKANYRDQIAALTKEVEDLNNQVEYFKKNNNQVLNQLENLSVITSAQSESIKKSMENIGQKDAYIYGLQNSLAQRDSLNMALVLNLKGAIGNLNDKDINIKVDKGVVFIDISDKMLFKSGSYQITDQASLILGKVAKVLKNQPHLEFMVEGHTDNVPFKRGDLVDNWDLSVKRATSVVRLLHSKYGIDPSQMTAAGRSEYLPIQSNETSDGKSANRRTRIVILPQLDQFFKLLEKK
jgi:chemotaxis protein MotB